MAKLSEVKSIDSMIAFLKEKGKNHECYYHYTTWDSLKKIIQNIFADTRQFFKH